jgi:hypothetical protein
MGLEPHHEGGAEKAPRPPQFADLTRLCAELNRLNARYLVIGGFAIIQHGFPRLTNDIDLLIETTPENESRVIQALLILPDKAAAEIRPGEIEEFGVIRVGDEILVDLMKSGCGIEYGEASKDAEIINVEGVPIPFASALTLWRMKQTVREKDIADRLFLRQLLQSEGIEVAPQKLSSQDRKNSFISWLRNLFGV